MTDKTEIETCTWPNGYATFKPPQKHWNTRTRAQWDKARYLLRHGSPSGAKRDDTPAPRTPRIAYRDPGNPRLVESAIESLGKILARSNAGEDPVRQLRHAKYVSDRRAVLPGWHLVATNGHVAICRPGDGTPPSVLRKWVPLFRTSPETWRAYGSVRTCRHPRSHGVQWDLKGTVLTYEAHDPEADATARAWRPVDRLTTSASSTGVLVNDDYIWPLRGIEWRVGLAGQAIVLERDDVAVVIMGMTT